MNIRRLIRRSAEEIAATREIARVVGARDALATFKGKVEIQRMCRDGYREDESRRACLLRKHEVMLRYYRERYADSFSQYDFDAPLPDDDPSMRGKIWVCWWQGLDNAPGIVKTCVASIRRAANGHEVVVLDEGNFRHYADLPDWIVEKYEKGTISRTQFSDVLRFALLAQHGGIWLDSTILCSGPLPDDAFDRELFTVSRPNCDHMSVAAGRFSDFCIGCNYESRRVFASIMDACYLYWHTNSILIDYLTNDYLIVLLQQLDEKHVGRAFAGVAPSNPHLADLLVHLNEVYDEASWRQMSADTSIFKLSWKTPMKAEVDGKPTFYGRLISRGLA